MVDMREELLRKHRESSKKYTDKNKDKISLSQKKFYGLNKKRILTERILKDRAVKRRCVEYSGGKCERCGYDKCMASLDFHHIDPTQKEFSICQANRHTNWEKIQKELDKCMLLCKNCHYELHYEVWEIKLKEEV